MRLNVSHQSGFLRCGKEFQPNWHSPVGPEDFRAAQKALDQSAGLDLAFLRLGWTNRINVKEQNKMATRSSIRAKARKARIARIASKLVRRFIKGTTGRK